MEPCEDRPERHEGERHCDFLGELQRLDKPTPCDHVRLITHLRTFALSARSEPI